MLQHFDGDASVFPVDDCWGLTLVQISAFSMFSYCYALEMICSSSLRLFEICCGSDISFCVILFSLYSKTIADRFLLFADAACSSSFYLLCYSSTWLLTDSLSLAASFCSLRGPFVNIYASCSIVCSFKSSDYCAELALFSSLFWLS